MKNDNIDMIYKKRTVEKVKKETEYNMKECYRNSMLFLRKTTAEINQHKISNSESIIVDGLLKIEEKAYADNLNECIKILDENKANRKTTRICREYFEQIATEREKAVCVILRQYVSDDDLSETSKIKIEVLKGNLINIANREFDKYTIKCISKYNIVTMILAIIGALGSVISIIEWILGE